MPSIVAIVITTIGAFISMTGALVGYFIIPGMIVNRVEESVKLIEGSEAFERWQNLPIPVVYKVYFFNVTNPEDVHQGAQPIVKEIGPYVYNQYRNKINITREDDVLSYYQHQLFEFDEEASSPLTKTDEITILNLPLMLIATVAEYVWGPGSYQLTALNASIASIFNNPTSVFMTTTPQNFLFDGIYILCNSTGIIDSFVCNQIENYAPKTMPRLEDGRFQFTLFGHKDDTNDGYYSINSGLKDVYKLGEILAWENSSTLDIWGEDGTCNDIVGSDASLFPPFRTPESSMSIFSTDICRSVSLEYFEKTKYFDIEAYEYVNDKNFLTSPSNYSANQCFCLNKTEGIKGDDGCLLDGAMELWSCQGDHYYLTICNRAQFLM